MRDDQDGLRSDLRRTRWLRLGGGLLIGLSLVILSLFVAPAFWGKEAVTVGVTASPNPVPPTWRAPSRSDMQPDPTSAISGSVRDSGGRPIPGATVALFDRGPSVPTRRSLFALQALSADTSGRFFFKDLRQGPYALTAVAAGYLPQDARAEVGRERSTQRIDFVLAPGGFELSGYVRDTGGGEIAGALVSRVPTGFETDAYTAYTAVSDDRGRYRLTLPAGDHRLVLRRDGYAEREIYVRVDRDQEIDVRLSAGARVSGRVVSRDDGSVVPGATVAIRSVRSSEDIGSSTTNADGRFAISGLPPGTYEVLAKKGALGGSLEGPLLLRSPGEQQVEIVLDGGAMISGQVTYPDGAPLAGARLTLGRRDSATASGDPAGSADAKGHFTIRGVLPEHTSVSAFGEGQAWTTKRIHLLRGERLTNLHLVVPAVGELEVAVTAAGRPVAGARVGVAPTTGRLIWHAEGVTGPAGTVVIPGIPLEQQVSVSARKPQVGQGKTRLTLSTTAKNLVQVSLEPIDVITVQGRAKWPDGGPAASVPVFLFCFGRAWITGTADDSGRYRFDGCEPGPVDVQCFHRQVSLDEWQRSYRPNRHEPLVVGEGTRIIDVVVAPGGKRIAGSVFGPGGQPLAGVQVVVRGAFEERSDFTTDTGSFAFDDLSRAPHAIGVHSIGHPVLHVETDKADATNLVLRLRAGLTLEGSVRTAEGRPRPYTRVMARMEDYANETYSDSSGAFILDGMLPGTYDVHVRTDAGYDLKVSTIPLTSDRRDLALVMPLTSPTTE